LIVVEGLDNTGKTTLVEQLVKDFPQLEYNPSIGNKHDLPQIHTQAWESINHDTPLKIWDRARFISEYVYNPILQNRELAFDTEEWLYMLAEYIRRPQLVIYCFRTPDRLIKDFDEREQLAGVFEHIPELMEAYDRVWNMVHFLFGLSPHDSRIYLHSFDHEDKEYKYPVIRKAVKEYLEQVEG
jgi:GTPase SAR1 family protein